MSIMKSKSIRFVSNIPSPLFDRIQKLQTRADKYGMVVDFDEAISGFIQELVEREEASLDEKDTEINDDVSNRPTDFGRAGVSAVA